LEKVLIWLVRKYWAPNILCINSGMDSLP